MAQEELQESKLTKAGGRKPTHGCNYPMVGWPSVILTPMGPSLNLTREGTSRPSLRSSLSLSLSLSHSTHAYDVPFQPCYMLIHNLPSIIRSVTLPTCLVKSIPRMVAHWLAFMHSLCSLVLNIYITPSNFQTGARPLMPC